MPVPANREDPSRVRARSRRGVVLSSFCIGVCGAVTLGLLECLAGAASSWRAAHRAPPAALVVAAFGKIALTQLILWPALMVTVGLTIACIRKLYRNLLTHAISALLAAFVMLSSLVVVPADLSLAHLDTPFWIAAALAGCAAIAAFIWVLGGRVERRHERIVARILYVGTVVAMPLAGVGIAAFVRSPLRSAVAFGDSGRPVRVAKVDRPHIVWIVLDTVRADRFGCHGYERPTTPNLDAWAAQGLLFENAHSNGIWTVPGHASMFTGLSLREHGADVDRTWLSEAIPTIAEQLAAHGYDTAVFSANPWVSRSTNLSRGFATAFEVDPLRRLGRFSIEAIFLRFGLAPALPWLDGDFGAAVTNHLVRGWLDASREDPRPRFVFVNYMEAHLPYRVPRAYRAKFMDAAAVARSYALRRSVFGEIADALHFTANIEGADFLSDSDRDVIRRQYDAAVRYLDDRVGELLDMFASRGMLENSIVVITSDHGEYLGEHGMWGHTFLCHAELTHVPLLLYVSGSGLRGRVETPVQLSDLYGTLLRAAGVELGQPAGFDARDLLEIARAPDERRAVVCEYGGAPQRLATRIRATDSEDVRRRAIAQIAVDDGAFRLLASADGRQELTAPSGQARRSDDQTAAALSRLAGVLSEFVRLALPRSGVEPAQADPARLIRSLRELGYLGGREGDASDEPP